MKIKTHGASILRSVRHRREYNDLKKSEKKMVLFAFIHSLLQVIQRFGSNCIDVNLTRTLCFFCEVTNLVDSLDHHCGNYFHF